MMKETLLILLALAFSSPKLVSVWSELKLFNLNILDSFRVIIFYISDGQTDGKYNSFDFVKAPYKNQNQPCWAHP